MPTQDDRQQQILDAAMALADEEGLSAVTMRAVAGRVGVTPMALYPHVGGKQGLLDRLLGRLLAEIPLPPPDLDWRERLVAIGHGLRDVGHRHPAVFPLLFANPAVTPDALRVVEALFAALREAGVSVVDLPRVERLVSTLAIGFVASEVSGRFGPGTTEPRQRRVGLPAAEFPRHAEVAHHLDAPVDWDAEFEAALDSLLLLVSTVAEQGG